jgi:hypothetical protein
MAELCGADARSGGAELVQLRIDVGGYPKVQEQGPQKPDDAGRKPIEIQLISAVDVVRSETFDATVNAYCARCDFATMCPAQQRSGTVLS